MKKSILLYTLFVSLWVVSCRVEEVDPVSNLNKVSPTADTYAAEIPLAWTLLELRLLQATPNFTPPVAARTIAYFHLAGYEAMASGSPTYRSLVGQLAGLAELPKSDPKLGYHWSLSAHTAYAFMARQMFLTAPPALRRSIDSMQTVWDARLTQGQPQALVDRSRQYGAAVASAIFDYSMRDGGHEGHLRNFPANFQVRRGTGLWEPTENGQRVPLQPFWGTNRCFAPANASLSVPTILRPSYDKNSPFFAEYKAVFDKHRILTQEEKEIAIWWADDPSETFMPPGHSISIAAQVLAKERVPLDRAAATLAQVGLAVSDAFVHCWKVKYTHFNERPFTYIRKTIDPRWVAFWPAPPFPGFSSGHATQSAATAVVLAAEFGENYAFTDRTWEGRPRDQARRADFKPRSFTSFWQTAVESANSRFFGGIHTKMDNDAGLAQGKEIGKHIINLTWERGK